MANNDSAALAVAAVTALALALNSQAQPPPPPPTNNKYSMISIVTWHGLNDLSSIDFSAITHLTIFHAVPHADGSISYDGVNANVPVNTINTAHARNVKAMLGVGGQGTPQTTPIYKAITSDTALTDVFINNIISEVNRLGYDGVHMDFEDDAPGSFNTDGYTSLILKLSAKLKTLGKQLDVTFALWESSVDYGNISKYADHMLFMFNPTSEQILTALQKIPAQKLAIGYDLNTYTPSGHQLLSNIQSGYGNFIWEASKASVALYIAMRDAITTQ